MHLRKNDLRQRTVRITLVVATLMAVVLAVVVGARAVDPQPGAAATATSVSYAIIATERDQEALVALDLSTGQQLAQLPLSYQGDVAVSAEGTDLYVLDTTWTGTEPTHRLARIDTASWTTVAETELLNRVLYKIAGPSTMRLSPDGTHLFIYSYRPLGHGTADYWLTMVDAMTLEVLPTQIALPKCGSAEFATTQRHLVALCSGSNVLHFIDPQAARIHTTTTLPPLPAFGNSGVGAPAALVVTPDAQSIYVVTNNMRIVQVNATTQAIERELVAHRQTTGMVPLAHAVALSADGDQLVVGTRAAWYKPTSLLTLNFFDLPSLTLDVTLPVAGYEGFVLVPTHGLYLLSHHARPLDGGSHMVAVRPDHTLGKLSIPLDGQVYRFVP